MPALPNMIITGMLKICEGNRMIDKKQGLKLLLISQMAAPPHLSVFPVMFLEGCL